MVGWDAGGHPSDRFGEKNEWLEGGGRIWGRAEYGGGQRKSEIAFLAASSFPWQERRARRELKPGGWSTFQK